MYKIFTFSAFSQKAYKRVFTIGYNAPHHTSFVIERFFRFFFHSLKPNAMCFLLSFSAGLMAESVGQTNLVDYASQPNKEWEHSLISLLDSAVHLQKAFYAQADKQVSLSSAKMAYHITQLEKFAPFLPYHQSFYVQNLLKKLKPPVHALIKPQNRRVYLKNIKFIVRTLTYMANMYGLNKYAVVFCPKDRSVWMWDKRAKIKKVSYRPSASSLGSACEQVPFPRHRRGILRVTQGVYGD